MHNICKISRFFETYNKFFVLNDINKKKSKAFSNINLIAYIYYN